MTESSFRKKQCARCGRAVYQDTHICRAELALAEQDAWIRDAAQGLVDALQRQHRGLADLSVNARLAVSELMVALEPSLTAAESAE